MLIPNLLNTTDGNVREELALVLAGSAKENRWISSLPALVLSLGFPSDALGMLLVRLENFPGLHG